MLKMKEKKIRLNMILSATFMLLMNSKVTFAFGVLPTSTKQSSSLFLSFMKHKRPKRYSILQRMKNENNDNDNDMGGGIFFDGPTDFIRPSSQSPTSEPFLSSSSSSSSLSEYRSTPSPPLIPTSIPKDVVVIGAGLAGLSAALHLARTSPHHHITILDSQTPAEQLHGKTTAGSFAAAGMLAPHSERLPSGPLLDLCLQSRDMYSDFVHVVEEMAKKSGVEGKPYLWKNEEEGEKKLEPWECGYISSGGFLAPAFAGDAVATWAPPTHTTKNTAKWLDEIQVRELEPRLHEDVIGGWWFPEDASVDARRLTCSLRAACVGMGVQFLCGMECGGCVESLELGGGRCKEVRLSDGRVLSPNTVIVANGSWMRDLLPVPITPHKGQSFSVRMPSNSPPILSRVLFAQDTYIVPKADGRIVVGATVEAGTFDKSVTPAGLMHCISNALQLVPSLADLPIEETWSGMRPTTPDKGPILGCTPWKNLHIAGGYWRNGVLLAPKTGQLLADLVMDQLSKEDEALLGAFSWDRFTDPGRGKELAAKARYASAMHPVHSRSKGEGVAASVGTELGFYEGAGAATDERKRDREAMFGGGGDDDFERAAQMGLEDASAFSLGDEVRGGKDIEPGTDEPGPLAAPPAPKEDRSGDTFPDVKTPSPFEGSADAITVGSASPQEDSVEESPEKGSDLASIYNQIRSNKAKAASEGIIMSEKSQDERPDPGFRIYRIDHETREKTMVPPYTTPEAMEEMIQNQMEAKESLDDATSYYDESSVAQKVPGDEDAAPADTLESDTGSSEKKYDETTFDGYQVIQAANSAESRDDELESMRKARQRNRLGSSEVDISQIGAIRLPDSDERNQENTSDLVSPSTSAVNEEQQTKSNESDSPSAPYPKIGDMYAQIRSNKAKAASSVVMGEKSDESRPDPGFRIYRIDHETREKTMVPPYTTPEAMEEMVAKEKEQKEQEGQPSQNSDSEALEEDYAVIKKTIEQEQQQQESQIDETTFDGYQDIQQANSAETREEELRRMKESRMRNRDKTSGINESMIGAQRMDMDD